VKRGNGESMLINKDTKKMGMPKELSKKTGNAVAELREVPKPALRRTVDVVIAEVEHRAFAYNSAHTDMVENELRLAKSQQWADDAKHELNRVKKELDALIAAIGR
jgi:hypothetical protein